MPADPSPRPKRPTSGGPASLAPGLALLPLRLFLGVTFVYAGLQKLSDPGFLHPGAPTYIGSLLQGYAGGTPGGLLLRPLALPHPALAGVGVAVVEIAIGLLTVGGLLTRAAAGIGLALNLLLFLTASWHTTPYFMGSDIVFVFAWLPLVLAGAAGQPALDHALAGAAGGPRRQGGRRSPPDDTPAALSRRALLARGLAATGGLTAAAAGIAAATKGPYRAGSALVGTEGAPTAPPPTATPRRKAAAVPPGAVRIGPARRLGAGQGALYRDPGDGQPDIVVRAPGGGLHAHSAVCTHAGCTVALRGGVLACPCHGSTFNARTGAVEQGPADQPLAPRAVLEHAGDLYALRA